jgi:hypothetical protein
VAPGDRSPWLLGEFSPTLASCATEEIAEVVDLADPAVGSFCVVAINQRGDLGPLADRCGETERQNRCDDERPED